MSAEAPVSHGFWSAEDTSPLEIEAALERLLKERYLEGGRAYAPARVLNLVVVVDPRGRGEVIERLEGIGRVNPSRTVICLVEEDRSTLGAWATMACEVPTEPGALSVCRERVELQVGAGHLPRLASVIDSLLVSDLPTVAWSPHGLDDALDGLLPVADIVLIDSRHAPTLVKAVEHAAILARRAGVVDLAWLRTNPWRERAAGAFEPPSWRQGLAEVDRVTVRHGEDSAVSGLLLVGWLASRLRWSPGHLHRVPGGFEGAATSDGGEIEIVLQAAPELEVPGLAGFTVETRGGLCLRLDRSPGGLFSVRRDVEGRKSAWKVLGASRGEGGVLGEALRGALVPDPTYRPALTAACALLE
jgi:glucose-6-phosphate dehydrogenase assembly protein OpcA